MLLHILQLEKRHFHNHTALDWIPLGLQYNSEKRSWLHRLQRREKSKGIKKLINQKDVCVQAEEELWKAIEIFQGENVSSHQNEWRGRIIWTDRGCYCETLLLWSGDLLYKNRHQRQLKLQTVCTEKKDIKICKIWGFRRTPYWGT